MTPDGGQQAAGVTYGIDIGGTKVLGVALDRAGTIVAEARVATPKGTRNIIGSHVAAAVAEVVAGLDRTLGATAPTPLAVPVGVGAPGMVDHEGRLRFAPNLPQAQGVDWNELMGDQLPGRTLLIENDANFAVLAEQRLGAARGHDHVVMVTLGTGIGGGLMIGGRVQVGSAGFAGEIGHMVVDPNGPPCPCRGAAAGSASPRAPGWGCWPGRPPWRGGWARSSGSPAATPRACGARTSRPQRRRATRRRSR